MTAWDAARVASKRPLPRQHKMHGPVGSPTAALVMHTGPRCVLVGVGLSDLCCQDCGHHVCSCLKSYSNLPKPAELTVYGILNAIEDMKAMAMGPATIRPTAVAPISPAHAESRCCQAVLWPFEHMSACVNHVLAPGCCTPRADREPAVLGIVSLSPGAKVELTPSDPPRFNLTPGELPAVTFTYTFRS